jgi:hypothetical protein
MASLALSSTLRFSESWRQGTAREPGRRRPHRRRTRSWRKQRLPLSSPRRRGRVVGFQAPGDSWRGGRSSRRAEARPWRKQRLPLRRQVRRPAAAASQAPGDSWRGGRSSHRGEARPELEPNLGGVPGRGRSSRRSWGARQGKAGARAEARPAMGEGVPRGMPWERRVKAS